MSRTIKLNELTSYLAEFEYPLDRNTAIDRSQDTTLVLADGEENLGELLERSNADEFDSEDELEAEVFTHLPRNAVGEPHQSEGDA